MKSSFLPFLRITLILGTLWDVITSFLGIAGLLGVTNSRNIDISAIGICVTAIVGSLIILALSLYSEEIWSKEKDLEGQLLKIAHILTVFFDAYTSFLGTAQNLILRGNKSIFLTVGMSEVLSEVGGEEIFVLLVVTLLITASPIVLSRQAKL